MLFGLRDLSSVQGLCIMFFVVKSTNLMHKDFYSPQCWRRHYMYYFILQYLFCHSHSYKPTIDSKSFPTGII